MILALPCPFCGRSPGWQDKSPDGSIPYRHLACVNPGCKLQVLTRRAASDEELIQDWNRRVRPEEAVIKEQIREHIRGICRRAKERAADRPKEGASPLDDPPHS
jgi:Restriction alleviation protein Lar